MPLILPGCGNAYLSIVFLLPLVVVVELDRGLARFFSVICVGVNVMRRGAFLIVLVLGFVGDFVSLF